MFVITNFLLAIAQILNLVLWLYTYVLLGRIIVSWVNADPYNPIVRFLYSATEPLLYRIRRTLPLVVGNLDLSPILLFIAIFFAQTFLVQSLQDLALTLE